MRSTFRVPAATRQLLLLPFRFAVLPLLILIGPFAGHASAVTIQELLDYKGKLSDDVLVALIESDGSVFHLSIEQVAALRDQGLSERVLLAMLRTAKKPSQPAPQAPSVVVSMQPSPSSSTSQVTSPSSPTYGSPQVAVDESGQPIVTDVPDQGQAVAKTAPVVVNVKQDVSQRVDASQPPNQSMYGPYNGYYGYGYPVGYPYGVIIGTPAIATRPVAPVFWGWNGKQRPDSWQLTPTVQKPELRTNQPTTKTTTGTAPMKTGGG